MKNIQKCQNDIGMNLWSHSRRQPSGPLIRYNHIVNKQIFKDKGQMVTRQNMDELNSLNVYQRYICRAIPTGEKPNTDKGWIHMQVNKRV